MRFKITLNIEKHIFGNSLPFNYQYEQSAVIYKILSMANKEYSEWLHNNGFISDSKQFRLFTYSRLNIPLYEIDKTRGCILIKSNTVDWYVSFLPEESTEKFVQGVFMNQTIQLGNYKNKIQLHVQNIEVLPSPVFETEMMFETLSPICIGLRGENGKTDYLSPNDSRTKEAILFGLISKYHAFYGKPFEGSHDFNFEVLNIPKSTLVTFKAGKPEESKVRGYMCRFRMKADNILMKMMYESGIGMKGSQGWGMVKVINKYK